MKVDPSFLQRYSLFGGIEGEDIEKLLPLLDQRTLNEGEVIIRQGERNDRIYFILRGRVAVYSQNLELSEFGAGDTFGEMEVLDVMPSAANIKALEETELISISNRALHQIYKQDVKTFAYLIMNLARDLSRRLRKMNEKASPENFPSIQ